MRLPMPKPYVVDSAGHVDALKAEIKRMRPVYRAAMRWHKTLSDTNADMAWRKTQELERACEKAGKK